MQELPELTDVDAIGMADARQITLNIDRELARQYGVDMSTVASMLNNAFSQRQDCDTIRRHESVSRGDGAIARLYLPTGGT